MEINSPTPDQGSDEVKESADLRATREALKELGLTEEPKGTRDRDKFDEIYQKFLWQYRAKEVGLPPDSSREEISEALRKKMAKTLNLPEDTSWEVINTRD